MAVSMLDSLLFTETVVSDKALRMGRSHLTTKRCGGEAQDDKFHIGLLSATSKLLLHGQELEFNYAEA